MMAITLPFPPFLLLPIDRAHLLVKEDGILAGWNYPKSFLQKLIRNGSEVFYSRWNVRKKRRHRFYRGSHARSILTAERLVLNCMQRMSGIATATWHLVKLLDGLHTKVIDTRRQLPVSVILRMGGANWRRRESQIWFVRHDFD